jgi:hypothetical protein
MTASSSKKLRKFNRRGLGAHRSSQNIRPGKRIFKKKLTPFFGGIEDKKRPFLHL